MDRWLALAVEPEENSTPLPDTLTKPDRTQPEGDNKPFCRVMSGCQVEVQKKDTAIELDLVDALDAAEERAAIMEYDGGLTREEAEAKAIERHLPDITAAVGNGCAYPKVSFALLDRLIALGQLVKLADGSLRKGGAT